jgi:uncharacterized membrane protein
MTLDSACLLQEEKTVNSNTRSIVEPSPSKRRLFSNDWLIPLGLIALSLIPALAGASRLVELGGGAEITSENARFFTSPVPVVLHIISVTLYSILGALQFSRGLRRRKIGWHRAIGRLLVPCGLVAALTGLWMSQFYDLPPVDGQILYVLRLIFGWGMVGCIVLGIVAIRRRDYAQHGAWMIRGYAIGLGAGTQVLTNLPWFIAFGTPGEFPRAVLMGAGWVINLAVAEWVIRKRPTRKTQNLSNQRQGLMTQ